METQQIWLRLWLEAAKKIQTVRSKDNHEDSARDLDEEGGARLADEADQQGGTSGRSAQALQALLQHRSLGTCC